MRTGLVLGVIAVGAVVAIVLATQRPAPPATADSSAIVLGAATVQRRDLVETDTESGTLSYADPQTVYDRLSGTITWLPGVGQAIRRGQVLFEVDNEPVILLYGSTPGYRQLSSSDSTGPDIRQLNSNLIALGYGDYGVIADDSWQTATTDAVEALQQKLGEKQTGTFALGRVVFLPDEQLVNAVDGAVGSPTALDRPTASAEFVGLTTDTAPTTTTSTGGKRHRRKHRRNRKRHRAKTPNGKAGTAPASSTASGGSSSSSGSKSSSGASASGSGGSTSKGSGSGGSTSEGSGSGGSGSGATGPTGTAILQTSSTHLIATVDLSASSQSEAAVGSQVSVEMPNGTSVGGTITAVSPIAQTSSNNTGSGGAGGGGSGAGGGSGGNGGGSGGGGSSSSATVPVTIALDQHVKGGGLDQAAVSVGFAQARARNVLSVPVTSLLATPGGGYAVQEAVTPHRLVPVTTGLFAAGFVQISGPGVYPGLQVTDSQG
jgi:putative peptidoglycan binding protein